MTLKVPLRNAKGGRQVYLVLHKPAYGLWGILIVDLAFFISLVQNEENIPYQQFWLVTFRVGREKFWRSVYEITSLSANHGTVFTQKRSAIEKKNVNFPCVLRFIIILSLSGQSGKLNTLLYPFTSTGALV